MTGRRRAANTLHQGEERDGGTMQSHRKKTLHPAMTIRKGTIFCIFSPLYGILGA